MELSQYLETVREQVANTSALADENTQQVAQKLSASLDSALRLSLIQALSDAASEISAELAPTSVEVRMAGSDPEFVVHAVSSDTYTDDANEETDDDDDDFDEPADDEDEPMARFSLRLPASVKRRIDEVAAEEQISTNAWITRTLMNHLRRREGRGPRADDRGKGRGRRGRGRGGWGPGGPGGPWGPGSPWGPGGPHRPPFPPGPPMAGRGYQGWV